MGQRIVVGIDPSERPLDPARLGAQLAGRMGLPLVLVTVFVHIGPEDDEQRALRERARADLLELGREIGGITVEDAVVVASSSPARALQEQSESAEAAMIVVGSTARGALRRVLTGSVAQQLLAGAACPVAVAPHGHGELADRDLELVGVAFDGSDESRQALASGRALARDAGARLRIISATDGVERDLRAAHDAAVDDEPSGVESVFAEGDPVDVLVEQSRELDVLLTGSRGYGPLGAVLVGGTTRELTTAAECPLIVFPRRRSDHG